LDDKYDLGLDALVVEGNLRARLDMVLERVG
jgi:hypothetical protein